MKFHWNDNEKEHFYKKAEHQLQGAGIDFIGVDRGHFGVRGWNEAEQTVEAVIITLKPFLYSKLKAGQRRKLKSLENWECLDRYKPGEAKPIFMHSRLVYIET